ncbi:endoplasmic reticulum-golgi intermediate compartment-domain-containing protein [Pelagophyceae sp. CCMP2097]|nr:endoplasmic reticulum-golgi intermediate compartment-domain-containing protein [Pelagophyceae sp. CCMP2097]
MGGGLKMVDFFRKIPTDLTETTVLGAALSVTAGFFMMVLFVVELWAFLATTIETGVMLDTNAETLLRINFNVTMMEIQCDYVAVDVVDVLGTNSMNVTKNVEKWQLDEFGKRMIFQGRCVSGLGLGPSFTVFERLIVGTENKRRSATTSTTPSWRRCTRTASTPR